MINDVLSFLFNNYQYYFIVFFCLCASFGFLLWKRKQGKSFDSVITNTLLYICIASLDVAASILIKHHFSVQSFSASSSCLFAFLLEMVLAATIGVVVTYFAMCLLKLLHTVCTNSWFQKKKYGFGIFFYYIVLLFLNLPGKIDGWVSVWYVTDYSDGISSRFFLGSIIKLFFRDYLDARIAYCFCMLSTVTILFLASMLLNEIIRKATKENKDGVQFLVILFLISPASLSGMWSSNNFGKLEYYCLLLTLVAIFGFEKMKNVYIKYFVVTCLSCISMAIYQGYVFMFYSMILMLFVYEGLKGTDHIWLRRILGFISATITGISFLFFQFYSNTIFISAEQMQEELQHRTNMPIDVNPIAYELFKPVSDAFNEINISYLKGAIFPRESVYVVFILLLPIVIVLLGISLRCRKYRKENHLRILVCPYVYYLLLGSTIIVQFALNIDWGRWMISLSIVLFSEIFYLIYKEDKGMLAATNGLSIWVHKHKFLCLLIIGYLADLGTMNSHTFFNEVSKIIEWMNNTNLLHM